MTTSDGQAQQDDIPKGSLPEPKKWREIVNLARLWRAGQITFDVEIPPELLGMVFLPLKLGALRQFTKDEVLHIATYGFVSDSIGTINGHPIHREAHFILRSDLDRVADVVDRLEQAETAVLADLGAASEVE